MPVIPGNLRDGIKNNFERIGIESNMMANVRVPTPLRPYTQGKSEIQVGGQTVAEAMIKSIRISMD